MKIIKQVFILSFIFIFLEACGSNSGQTEKYSEKFFIPINGKPILVPYSFHLKKGMLTWNFKGELSDTVRVGISVSKKAFEIPDSILSFPAGDTIIGKVKTVELGGIEFISRGDLTWLVLLPKTEAKGEIEIEFNESAVGFLF